MYTTGAGRADSPIWLKNLPKQGLSGLAALSSWCIYPLPPAARSVLVYVIVCLLMSRPIPERHFHFRAVGRGFGMYKNHQMAQRYFKIESINGLIYRYYILIPYVERTDQTTCSRFIGRCIYIY